MARRKRKRTRETTVKKKVQKKSKTGARCKNAGSKEPPERNENRETKKNACSKECSKKRPEGKEKRDAKNSTSKEKPEPLEKRDTKNAASREKPERKERRETKNSGSKENVERKEQWEVKKDADSKERPERKEEKETKKKVAPKERPARNEKETKKNAAPKERPARSGEKDAKTNTGSKEFPVWTEVKKMKKNTGSKEKSAWIEEKRTNALAGEYYERVKELQKDGILILIDKSNLEISNEERMEEKQRGSENLDKAKKRRELKCVINYDELIDVIARDGYRSRRSTEKRRVLGAFVVTSRKPENVSRVTTTEKGAEKSKIEFLVPPVRAVHREKGVDCMIVRKIVEEYTSLDMIRLHGKKVPRRTFCIVSADSDFVDVAKEAVAKGFDVELWMFPDYKSFNRKLWRRAHECASLRCGRFSEKDLGKHENRIATCGKIEHNLHKVAL